MVNTDYMYEDKQKLAFIIRDNQVYLTKRDLAVLEIKNGVFLPWKEPPKNGPLHGIGGVVDEEGNYVDLSACLACGETRDRFRGSYPFDASTIKKVDETIVYLGLFHKQWGHFLVDFVPRIWFFLYNNVSYRIAYTSDSGDISGNYLRLLELAGIDITKLVRIDEPTSYNKIIIPEMSYVSGGYYTKEFISIYEAIKKNSVPVNADYFDKIYLSRRHIKWYKTKEIGEKGIENAFNLNEFKSLFLEELNLDQQIFYLSHASQIAALSGTLCHNMLFTSKSSAFIILNKTKRINEHQILINQANRNSVTYVDVYKEPYRKYPLSYGSGPFWVTNTTNEFSKYFNDHGLKLIKDSRTRVAIDFIKYTFLCWVISIKKVLLRVKLIENIVHK